MKITINPDNLICDENFQVFHKVRAIIENESGEFIISNEGGKCIFPGGRREKGESNIMLLLNSNGPLAQLVRASGS